MDVCKLFVCITLFVLTLTSCVSPVNLGYEHYKQGNYQLAINTWLPEARSGDADAQHNMGVLFEHGQGVKHSYEEAANWYVLAAKQGRVDSMVALANVQMKLNYRESAISWYQLAARWNHQKARSALSRLGEYVPSSDLHQQQLKQQQENDYLMGLAITGIASALTGYYQAPTPTNQYTPPTQTFSGSTSESNNRGCLSDYSCPYGQKCIKEPYSTRGVCAVPVNNYGTPAYTPPSSDSINIRSYNDAQCQTNMDCPIFFRCDQELKVCFK
ncbi:sel1 repeat family protein [Alteromonas sp. IB21]|uniref:tetratricopeptide repeat protein n=1 Tax=Alteromonas sp. IB21 TaxID=2779369 RepID=UPI0018E82CAD|nr:tetratricopeptide repeat protein [Alteromonas sp. IB21]MBJ2128043.1 sel1 repeat family protein [Alteromonas sp. IB21]